VLANILLSLIVGISIVLMLIRPRNIPEVYWIAGGVLLLLVLRLLPLQLAGRAVAKALDVCFFLIGMMLLSELAREHGVFDCFRQSPCGVPAAPAPGCLRWSTP